MPAEPRTVRAVLSGRRLLVALVLALLVPAALGVAAFTSEPEPAPTHTALRHPLLPQAPDSVAVTQFDRSAAATRLARRLAAPQLLAPARIGTGEPRAGRPGTLPTLALAPRNRPYSLVELRTLVPAAFSAVDGAVLLAAHLEVPVGAALVIDARTPDVRLTSGSSGFATLFSRGTTTVRGTAKTPVRISTWDPQRRAADTDMSDGRSFVMQIGGRMDADHGRFEYLGFGTGISSGVAWRGATLAVAGTTPNARRIPTRGTVANSLFAHNRFGAYTHEAQGMHWVGNTFTDNEVYGFDPHDFSNDFVVEGNIAHHNGKHGFIFSRGCARNVLRGNTAYANGGHGLMIDDGRSTPTATIETRLNPSDNNLVTRNTAYDNAGSGVEIEGSSGNIVSNNHLTRNDVGVRIKDGAVATVRGNTIDNSVRYGIHVLDRVTWALISDNRISGSWAAINLASASSAALGANPSTDVSTPLVVDGVADRDPSWTERVKEFLRWNPALLLWGLILGVPGLVAVLRVLWSPLVRPPERGPDDMTVPRRNATSRVVLLLAGLFLLLTACDSAPARNGAPPPAVSESNRVPWPADVPAADRIHCPDSVVEVSTSEQLHAELRNARPGTVIGLADGVYDGTFTASTTGTAQAPLWLCGGAGAVLRGPGTDDGTVLHLEHVRHWRLVGFTVREGRKGVMADGTGDTVIQNLTVTQIGDEAVHLRANSTRNVVRGLTVSDTGLRRVKFGEGIYIGSAASNWCEITACQPDRSDHNVIVGNSIRATTAESVDIKEGTTGGVLADNTFDGADLAGDANSWVDVKGNGWLIQANRGSTATRSGFEVSVAADGWGTANTFDANTADVRGPGYGYELRPPADDPAAGNRVTWSNTATGADAGITNTTFTRPDHGRPHRSEQ
jgi:parallel beta-helix repeat protein